MYLRTSKYAIGGALILGLGAMVLIPANPSATVASATTPPSIASVSSEETIAAIDAMLGASAAPAQQAEAADSPVVEPAAAIDPESGIQPAALVADVPDDTFEPEPVIDPSFRPDSIGSSAVNLRAGPSTDTAPVTVLTPGQAVHVGEIQGGWIEVALDDGTSGWVYARYLASEEAKRPAPQVASADESRATVSGGSGNLAGRTARIEARLAVRSQPSIISRTLFRTEPGERVRIVDVDGSWLQIETADGSTGWIRRG